MAQLTVVSLPGKAVKELTSLLQGAATTDKFQNPDGRTFLLIDGGTAPTGAVVVASTPCSHGRTGEDLSQSPATDTQYLMGPFSPAQYNDANGDVNIATDTVTDIKLLPVRF